MIVVTTVTNPVANMAQTSEGSFSISFSTPATNVEIQLLKDKFSNIIKSDSNSTARY